MTVCKGCQAQLDAGYPLVPDEGRGRVKYLIVGDSPGDEESKDGRPFSPKAEGGLVLRRALRELGVQNYALTNAVKVRTGRGNPDPPMKWIRACRETCMRQTLDRFEPDVIVCLGSQALKSFTDDGNISLTRSRHQTFWYEYWTGEEQYRRIPVVATWPPIHTKREKHTYGWWLADLEAYMIRDSWDRKPLETTWREVERLTPGALNQQELTVDVETTGLEPWNGDRLRCTGVRPRGSVTSIVTGVDGGKADLRRLLMDPSKTLIMHNGQFDCMWGLEDRELPGARVVDTLYLHYLLDERYPSRGLKHLGRLYTPYEPIDLPRGGLDHETSEVLPYCADDVAFTDLVRAGIEGELDELGVEWKKNMDLYGRAIPILAGMTNTGIPIDRNVLEEARRHEQEQVDAAIEHLKRVWDANKPLYFSDDCPACEGSGFQEAGDGVAEPPACDCCSGEGWCWLYQEFDIRILDRHHHLSDFIYGELGYPIPDMKGAKRKDKRGSTAREVLEASIAMNGDPSGFVKAIFAYKDVHENLRKYVLDVEKRLGLDQRLRPRFNIVTREDRPGKQKKSGAKTGRMSVSQPAVQNTPGGHPMRRAFIPLPGDIALVQIDRAQAELTDLAQISGDHNMTRLINNKVDQHQRMADLASAAGYGMVRDEAKTVNFGILYGIGPKGLEQRTRFDKRAGARFIDMWFAEYPDVKALQRRVHYLALKRGFVETLSGRRRNFPLGLDKRGGEGSRAERQAFNFIIQALANDLNMLFLVGWCMQGLWELGFPTFLIHDAVLFSTPDPRQMMEEFKRGYATWYADMVEEFLGEDLNVVMRADAKFGPNWGSMIEKDDEGRKLFYFSTDPKEGYIDYDTLSAYESGEAPSATTDQGDRAPGQATLHVD